MQELKPVVFDFNTLLKIVNKQVSKLAELFRLHFFYLKIITGKGLEFDRLREFQEGDEANLIDWNALARTTEPYIKVFKEERKLDIIFLIDVSNSMLLGTTELTKNQYASILVGILGYAAYSSGDAVGGLFFSDKIKFILEPNLKAENYYALVKLLSNPKIYGGKKDWSYLPKYIFETYSPDSVFFILSDFIGFSNLEAELINKLAARFNRVFGVMIRDPLDSYIPEGIGEIVLGDPFTGKSEIVNLDKLRKDYNKAAKEEEKKVEKAFLKANSLFLKVHTNENFVDIFIKYFKKADL